MPRLAAIREREAMNRPCCVRYSTRWNVATLQCWIAWEQHDHGLQGEAMWYGLLVLIAQQTVGNRPGRLEPSAIKRRPKPYPLLTKPCAIAREDARRYGRPEKPK